MSSRLPETDLANWSFLSRDQKRDALERHIRPKQIIGSYEPFRRIFADAVNEQLPLFADDAQPATPWHTIEQRLRRSCRNNPALLAMNLEIARSTHAFAEAARITALRVDITSIAFGVGHLYEFGLPLLMRYPDRVAAVFLDLRRTNGVAVPARDWVFSAMHERFRAAYPDLANIDREIWRYKRDANRSISVIKSDSESRYTFGEMAADARETYEIYASVAAGDREQRRRAGGGSGPLFG